LLALAALALPGISMASPASAKEASAHHFEASIFHRTSSAAGRSETSRANLLEDVINTLGVTRYPKSFEGIRPASGSALLVYATHYDKGLKRAVRLLPHYGVSIHWRTVNRSYAQLDNLTERLAHDTKSLSREGIALQSWAPDPETDSVRITLATPSRHTRAALYIDSARTRLQRQFGTDWITVSSTTSALMVAASSRDNDSSPYRAGDSVRFPSGDGGAGDFCTDGFAVTKSRITYILTAGHCGGGDVYLNGVGSIGFIGPVSKRFFQPIDNDELDFEYFQANQDGQVWNGPLHSSSHYDVTGFTTPGNGSLMTLDGDQENSQVTGLLVDFSDACTTITDGFYGTYTVCHLGQVSDNASSGPVICRGGDSGGPAYVRAANPDVVAAGTIESVGDGGHTCDFEQIAEELSPSLTGLTLKTS